MTRLRFDRIRKVLCLGAHSDDIEIGCGGTMLRLLRDNPNVQVHWVVFTASPERMREARASARSFLSRARSSHVEICSYRESFFPAHWAAIKEFLEQVRKQFEPDLIFTHFRDDRHQDHRVVSDLTWNTFRNHLILEYEIPKYDGDLRQPNVFFPLNEDTCRKKVSVVLRHFKTQSKKHWFTEETFYALLRLRGVECASESNYAEAFYGRKLSL